ncbi:unnamed protein product [Mytilus coruscus]|uniref:B box-type domain-containing protein n=1 Tax=Mytilus coruscus TaxID=42192 RepID=A0A6J8ALG9_MYTCO|nr:unnamed protein product [Mytilus coruscus]
MASSKPIQCEPCYKGKINTEADIWCYNCDAGLCSTCLSHHKRSNETHDHNTIDIKRYKKSTRAIKTECDIHGQQLNLYCPSHLMPCCDECISTRHSKCTGITSLARVQYIEDMENDERAKEVYIKMKKNDEIEKVLSKLRSLNSLGEVMVVTTEVVTKRETKMNREAQVESREKPH